MDIINKFIENAINTNYEDLPSDVIHVVKKCIIDSLGNTIAGSRAKGCDIVADQFLKWGGKEESTVLGYYKKIPCANAAFLNGIMGRALEIDDCIDTGPVHPSVSIIPACFALSEAIGGVDGKHFITSVALGHDIIIRMSLSGKYNVFQTGRYNMFKIFGPALSCSKILRQNFQQTLNTLGLAYTLMVGDGQCALDGALSLRFQQGHVAKSGVIAAIFGGKGITGAKNILQGRFGYYNAFDPEPDLDILTKDLGKEFYGKYITIKPYSCCRANHPAIDSVLEIIEKYNLTKEDVNKIYIYVSKAIYNLVGRYSIPRNVVEAQFSIPYNVACAVIFNEVFLEEHRERNFSNSNIIDLIGRISVSEKEECEINQCLGKTIVEVETIKGEKYRAERENAKGNYQNPMSFEDCVEKFIKCIKYRGITFKQSDIDKIVNSIKYIESVNNINTIIESLSELSHS